MRSDPCPWCSKEPGTDGPCRYCRAISCGHVGDSEGHCWTCAPPRTVLVTGSRDFSDVMALDRALLRLPVLEIVHGDARGADTLARDWALHNRIDEFPFQARWDLHGRRAGPIRNRRMLEWVQENGTNTLVMAFKEGFDPKMRKGGTEHMVKIALMAGLEVWINPHHEDFTGSFQLDLFDEL